MVRFLPATLLRSRLALTTAGGLLLAGTPSAQLAIYAVDGPGPDQAFGNSIAKLPDVNADGVPDLLVGAFTKNDSRGAACVLSGKTGVTLQSWNGTEEFEYLGQCVAAIGDIDKDGVNDVAIGAPYFDVGPASVAGRVLVCSAKTGTLLRTHLGPPSSANFGAAIAGLGDLDNDGTNDYAIGSPFLNVDGAYDQGQVTLFSGKTGAALLALNGPATQHGKFGTHIVNAGDVNGDGKADLAITSPEWVSAGGLHTGRVEVRSGANLNVTLFAAEGQLDGEKLGFALAAAGDVNHDGLADIIAATWFDNDDAGVARVFLGPSGAASWVFHGDAAFDHFGCSVDGAGDVDKDGWADLVVGAYRAAFQVMNQPGYARVFSGRTGQALVTLTGTQATDEFGYAVCGAGDLNGDGWADVAVGSVSWDGINGTASGRVTTIEVLKHATNLGFGGPGSSQLSMYGSALDDFGQMDLALSGAKPGAPAWLIASAGTSFTAFKGGVIVPDIGIGAIIGLTTNGSGKVTIPGILGGFGPVSIALQYVIKDAAQPFGYAMSNAVSANFLP